MSLGATVQGKREIQGQPLPLESLDEEQDAGLESLSSLAEEAVPMRDSTARELEHLHEERIRAVVGGGSRRLPRPTINARVLSAGAAAVVILALVAAALSSNGGGSASRGAAAQVQRSPVPQRSIEPDSRSARPRRPIKAHAQRRAAIPAKQRAARRHAQRERAHRRAVKAEEVRTQSEAPVTESPAPASAPAPVTATTESAPPPASSPPPSTSTNPVQEQFGFER